MTLQFVPLNTGLDSLPRWGCLRSPNAFTGISDPPYTTPSRPTPTEARHIEKHPNLVTDILIAIGVDGRLPEIQVFDPALAKPDAPPDPIEELRQETDVDIEDEVEDGAHDVKDVVGDREDGDEESGDKVGDDGLEATTKPTSIKFPIRGPPEPLNMLTDDDNSARRKRLKGNVGKGKRNPSLTPWSLVAKDWPAVVKRVKPQSEHTFKENGTMISKCAISPRGAKWIVGVGDGETVFVYISG